MQLKRVKEDEMRSLSLSLLLRFAAAEILIFFFNLNAERKTKQQV